MGQRHERGGGGVVRPRARRAGTPSPPASAAADAARGRRAPRAGAGDPRPAARSGRSRHAPPRAVTQRPAVQRLVATRRETSRRARDRPGVAHHPPLAAPLALDRRDHLLRGDARRAPVNFRPPAALDHMQQQGTRGHGPSPGRPRHRQPGGRRRSPHFARCRERRLLRAQPQLVAPVPRPPGSCRRRRRTARCRTRSQPGVIGEAATSRSSASARQAALASPNASSSPEAAVRPRPGPRPSPRGSSSTSCAARARRRAVGIGFRAAVDGHDQLKRVARPVGARARWRPWPRITPPRGRRRRSARRAAPARRLRLGRARSRRNAHKPP